MAHSPGTSTPPKAPPRHKRLLAVALTAATASSFVHHGTVAPRAGGSSHVASPLPNQRPLSAGQAPQRQRVMVVVSPAAASVAVDDATSPSVGEEEEEERVVVAGEGAEAPAPQKEPSSPEARALAAEVMNGLEGRLPESLLPTLSGFVSTYLGVVADELGRDPASALPVLEEYVGLVEAQLASPFKFQPYHRAVLSPVDHYDLDARFMEPLIDLDDSVVLGHELFDVVKEQLAAGDNVVFLSNHQTEADPSAWSALFDRGDEKWRDEVFARDMVMVAGDRVTTDPVAVPFSKARNLLCIYSKRHMDNPPERKREKQMHNTRTMGAMLKLLTTGGACVWVAPSGGRDRPDEDSGSFNAPAPFDPKSVEMFRVMANKISLLKKTHFWPMAMLTHRLFPPPSKVNTALGEPRIALRGSVSICLRPELDFDAVVTPDYVKANFPDHATDDKDAARLLGARYAYDECKAAYDALLQDAVDRASPYYP